VRAIHDLQRVQDRREVDVHRVHVRWHLITNKQTTNKQTTTTTTNTRTCPTAHETGEGKHHRRWHVGGGGASWWWRWLTWTRGKPVVVFTAKPQSFSLTSSIPQSPASIAHAGTCPYAHSRLSAADDDPTHTHAHNHQPPPPELARTPIDGGGDGEKADWGGAGHLAGLVAVLVADPGVGAARRTVVEGGAPRTAGAPAAAAAARIPSAAHRGARGVGAVPAVKVAAARVARPDCRQNALT
jgi:LysM repeat protein